MYVTLLKLGILQQLQIEGKQPVSFNVQPSNIKATTGFYNLYMGSPWNIF